MIKCWSLFGNASHSAQSVFAHTHLHGLITLPSRGPANQIAQSSVNLHIFGHGYKGKERTMASKRRLDYLSSFKVINHSYGLMKG